MLCCLSRGNCGDSGPLFPQLLVYNLQEILWVSTFKDETERNLGACSQVMQPPITSFPKTTKLHVGVSMTFPACHHGRISLPGTAFSAARLASLVGRFHLLEELPIHVRDVQPRQTERAKGSMEKARAS